MSCTVVVAAVVGVGMHRCVRYQRRTLFLHCQFPLQGASVVTRSRHPGTSHGRVQVAQRRYVGMAHAWGGGRRIPPGRGSGRLPAHAEHAEAPSSARAAGGARSGLWWRAHHPLLARPAAVLAVVVNGYAHVSLSLARDTRCPVRVLDAGHVSADQRPTVLRGSAKYHAGTGPMSVRFSDLPPRRRSEIL